MGANGSELGLVAMDEALRDEATGAAAGAKVAGLGAHDSAKSKEQYWCTLCGRCLTGRTAYNHRRSHGKEWGELRDPAVTQKLEEKLDGLYGALLKSQLSERQYLQTSQHHCCIGVYRTWVQSHRFRLEEPCHTHIHTDAK